MIENFRRRQEELLPREKDLEQSIKEHKKLPGIPSAEEISKTGVNLANMDAKLLQKIEELTLYVIELKKEINELKKEKEVKP